MRVYRTETANAARGDATRKPVSAVAPTPKPADVAPSPRLVTIATLVLGPRYVLRNISEDRLKKLIAATVVGPSVNLDAKDQAYVDALVNIAETKAVAAFQAQKTRTCGAEVPALDAARGAQARRFAKTAAETFRSGVKK